MSTSTDARVAPPDPGSIGCRRRRIRQELTSVLDVDFGAENSGIVLNLSEDGCSVLAPMPLGSESFSSMRLKDGPDGTCMQAAGRLVWLSASKKAAGVQFVDLSEHARRQIAEWIAADAFRRYELLPSAASDAPRNNPPAQSAKPAPSAACGDPNPQQFISDLFSSIANKPKDHQSSDETGQLPPLTPSAPDIASLEQSAADENAPLKTRQPMDTWGDTSGAGETILAIRPPGLQAMAASRSQPDPQHPAPPRLPHAEVSPYSTVVKRRILLLTSAGITVLAFVAGLTLGHRSRSRSSEAAQSSVAVFSERPTSPNPAPPKMIRDQTDASRRLDEPQPNSERDAGPANASALAGLLAHSPAHDSALLRRTPQNPPAPNRGQRTAPFERPVNTHISPLPKSARPAQSQPLRTTAEAVHPADARSAGSALDETATPGAIVARTGATASQRSNPDSRDSHVAQSTPAQPQALEPMPPAHVDPSYVIRSVEPVYPPEARKRHLQGIVELRVLVGTDGAVHSVNVVSGPPLLASAAIDAARQFRYNPASLNGHPIETIQNIEMAFQLEH